MEPFTPASDMAAAVRSGQVSPVELADSALDAIAALNPRLHAFLGLDRQRVMQAAGEAEAQVERGEPLGPLHGVPLAVKDLEATTDFPTTSGSSVFRDFVPDQDSILVERLRAAGAVVVGKTNTPAFGLLGETKNDLGEDSRNPWDTSRTTGGSSGGSAAAVASGIVPVATGTDSAGSITCPSGMCGIFGFKPTLGRVPMIPNAGDSLLFNHGGPLSRTVKDAALMLSVMAGFDARDPISLREPVGDYLGALEADVPRLAVAWSPDFGHFAVDPEVCAIAEAGAQRLAALGLDLTAETPEVDEPFSIYTPLSVTDVRVGLGDFLAEHVATLYPESIEEIGEVPPLSAEDYVRIYHRLLLFRSRLADFFDRYSLLVTPSTAVAAFPVGQPPSEIGGRQVEPGWRSFMPFQTPWNMTGQPCLNLPCGFTTQGLPVGMLVAAGRGQEELLFTVAAAYERAYPWTDVVPPIAQETRPAPAGSGS